jgi:hypothetical protein
MNKKNYQEILIEVLHEWISSSMIEALSWDFGAQSWMIKAFKDFGSSYRLLSSW